jgi:hypothetical protein
MFASAQTLPAALLPSPGSLQGIAMNMTRRPKTYLGPIEPDEPAGPGPAAPPAAADLPLMAALGIRYEGGVYRFACVHYDNLHDAANFARLTGASPDP